MDDTEVKARILEILDTFGMKDVKAAEIMGISLSSYKAKKQGVNYNKFHPENLENLINYIKEESRKLP
jgi:hypothetical protein